MIKKFKQWLCTHGIHWYTEERSGQYIDRYCSCCGHIKSSRFSPPDDNFFGGNGPRLA